MREPAFRRYCRDRKLSDQAIESAVAAVLDLEAFARERGQTLDSLNAQTLQEYISQLIVQGHNTPERLGAFLDYMRAEGQNELLVYLIGILSGREVIPSIAERLEQLAGPDVREAVFSDLDLPPLGSPQAAYPPLTREVVARLGSMLSKEMRVKVLAGNHHRIPPDRFAPLRAVYLEQGIDAVLAHRHRALLGQLEESLARGVPWFEQLVTPAFVDYVRQDQEIGAGRRAGDRIFFLKVPYAPQQYLDERDPTMRRYYQCHCPLARAAILDQTATVDPVFCYCSGGFTKVAFDVIFDEPVEVEVMESALAGDLRCRFAITIPPGKMR